MGIEELADRAGVSRRTVRYYVQRGLLPSPTGLGRGKHYTAQHLEVLVRIRELQEQGVSLTDIQASQSAPAEPAPPAAPAAAPAQSLWTRVAVSEDVELHVRGRRLGEAELRAMVDAITRVIAHHRGDPGERSER